jgi:hypothetical protein
MVTGIIARAAIGTIRHIGGGGRWYQGDRMVYFDGIDSVLFLGAAAVLALVVIRSPRPRTVVLGLLGVAPLVYAFVFSYRRSVWLGAVVAVAAVAVLEPEDGSSPHRSSLGSRWSARGSHGRVPHSSRPASRRSQTSTTSHRTPSASTTSGTACTMSPPTTDSAPGSEAAPRS